VPPSTRATPCHLLALGFTELHCFSLPDRLPDCALHCKCDPWATCYIGSSSTDYLPPLEPPTDRLCAGCARRFPMLGAYIISHGCLLPNIEFTDVKVADGSVEISRIEITSVDDNGNGFPPGPDGLAHANGETPSTSLVISGARHFLGRQTWPERTSVRTLPVNIQEQTNCASRKLKPRRLSGGRRRCAVSPSCLRLCSTFQRVFQPKTLGRVPPAGAVAGLGRLSSMSVRSHCRLFCGPLNAP
jgi:hypothetical protein